jgi:type II secretory pathway component GspD/PulD (secretin)
MSSLQPYLVSQDIWYENIGHNTLRFYEQKKLLKYEIFVFSGQNVDRFSVEELYLLTLQFDGIISGSKDRASLISKPVIYVNEGEPASIKSVLSVPVFDEEGKIVSKIESGFTMEVSGEYDNITKLVNTELDISISELKNEDKNIVDERNMSSKFTIPNGGFIKLGGLNFTSIVENESGIPIFKEIPVIGQLFTSYEKTENVYDLVILIHAEVSNKPEIENYF